MSERCSISFLTEMEKEKARTLMYRINYEHLNQLRATKWNAASVGRYLEGDFMQGLDQTTETNRAITFLAAYGIFQEPTDVCNACGNGNMRLYSDSSHKEGLIVKCLSGKCNNKRGAFKGMWVEGIHMKLKRIIYLTYYWTKKRTTVSQMKDKLYEVSPNTAVDHYNFLRELCERVLMEDDVKQIGRKNKICELDESKFRTRKYHKGKKRSGEGWVFGGICREDDQCFLVYVPNRSANTLIGIIKERIAPGTTLITDGWKGYVALKDEPDFKHMVVNHSVEFVDKTDPTCHTKKVEGMWHHAKNNQPLTGTTPDMSQSYLFEFMWRKRTKGQDKFAQILLDMARFYQYDNEQEQSETSPSTSLGGEKLERKVWNKVALSKHNMITIREMTRKLGHGTQTSSAETALKDMSLHIDPGAIFVEKNNAIGIKSNYVVKILPDKISENWLKNMTITRAKYRELFIKGTTIDEKQNVYEIAYTDQELIMIETMKQDNGK